MSIEDYKVGDRIKVLAHTTYFMRGFRYGTVVKIGTVYLHVAWNMHPDIVRRFRPQSVERIEQ